MPEEKTALWTKDFIIISVLNIFLFFSFQSMNAAFPLAVNGLGGSDADVGLNSFAMIAAALILRPLAGLALDRIGRKSIFLIGLVLAVASAFLCGLFKIIWVLTLLRLLQGTAWGISTTASSTISTDVIPKKRLGEGMGFFSLTMAISFALAPMVGLMLFSLVGFTNLAFISTGVIVLIFFSSFSLNYRKIERVKKQKRKFAPYETAALKPSIIMFFGATTIGAEIAFMSLYGESLNLGTLGIFFLVYSVGVALSRLFSGRMIDRYGANIVILPSFAALIIAMALLCFNATLSGILIAAAVQGIAYGALQVALQTLAIAASPDDRIGAANATFWTGIDGGIGTGSLIAGVLSLWFNSYNYMFLSMIAFLVIGAGLHFIFTRVSRSTVAVETSKS